MQRLSLKSVRRMPWHALHVGCHAIPCYGIPCQVRAGFSRLRIPGSMA